MENQKNLPYKILAISVIDYVISIVVFFVFVLSCIEAVKYGISNIGFGVLALSMLPALFIAILSFFAADSIRRGLNRGKIMHIALYLIIAAGLLYFALIVKGLYFNPLLYLVVLYAIVSSVILFRVKDLFLSKNKISTSI